MSLRRHRLWSYERYWAEALCSEWARASICEPVLLQVGCIDEDTENTFSRWPEERRISAGYREIVCRARKGDRSLST